MERLNTLIGLIKFSMILPSIWQAKTICNLSLKDVEQNS
jgi:hypothetical protein